MDYERIDKPQGGIISPSKLRMKLMGVSPKKRNVGSNCNSSTTSPSRHHDNDFVKNSLLASSKEDLDETVSCLEPQSVNLCGQSVSSSVESQNNCAARENIDADLVKMQQVSRPDGGNSSVVHPLKSSEDENLDYDSNASSSSFEFHKGERVAHRSLTRSLSRPTSYKWNDAEKWIVNKQGGQANNSKSHGGHSIGNRMPGLNIVRVAPETAGYDYRLASRVPETKRIDFSQVAAHMSVERFNIAPHGAEPPPLSSNVANVPIDLCPQSKDLKVQSNSSHDVAVGDTGIRAISMRDMGTEMTPVTSLEPSRTATPVGAMTPRSIPSSPRGELANPPVEYTADINPRNMAEKGDQELTEHELKLKTRREIVALGVQLGKMNIAAWASKADKDNIPSSQEVTGLEDFEHIEYEKRAAAWEEAEKTKHAARYKREEIKIHAWECQQKAKLEEELRRIEAKVEQLRTQSQAKMVKKISIARKRSEEKRGAAEARKKRQAEKTAAQAEYIRQTGRIPSSDFICCGFFS